jgi:mannose/fructose/N-acetylgalactosamine-specific phosphotransferase system component IIC
VLASVLMPVVVIGVVLLAVRLLRRRLLPAWAPMSSLAAIPVAILVMVVSETAGVSLPHPPAWILLGITCYGVALRSAGYSLVEESDGGARLETTGR